MAVIWVLPKDLLSVLVLHLSDWCRKASGHINTVIQDPMLLHNYLGMLSTFFVLIVVVVGDGLSVLARLTVAFLLLVDGLKLGCFN